MQQQSLQHKPCPSWCTVLQDEHHDDTSGHEEDSGRFHESDAVDTWVPLAESGVPYIAPITVKIDGFRHDRRPDCDWRDAVTVRGSLDGSGGGGEVTLPPEDARRLGHALIRAAETIDRANLPKVRVHDVVRIGTGSTDWIVTCVSASYDLVYLRSAKRTDSAELHRVAVVGHVDPDTRVVTYASGGIRAWPVPVPPEFIPRRLDSTTMSIS